MRLDELPLEKLWEIFSKLENEKDIIAVKRTDKFFFEIARQIEIKSAEKKFSHHFPNLYRQYQAITS